MTSRRPGGGRSAEGESAPRTATQPQSQGLPQSADEPTATGGGPMRAACVDVSPPRPAADVASTAPRDQSEPQVGSQNVVAPAELPVGSARSVLELVGVIIAPATLLTALAFYFGWTFTSARASYFGLDASALGFSTQDYLLRSADALFVPLGTILTLALGAVTLHAIVRRNMHDDRRTEVLRVISWVAVVVGGALFALGVFAAFKPLPFSPHYLLAPASPGIGIGVLAYGVYLRGRLLRGRARLSAGTMHLTRTPRSDVVLVCLVVVLSAFWTASVYADALGRGRAQWTANRLAMRPEVTVYSAQRMHLSAGGVAEQQLPGRDSAYRYRYSGLRLLIRSDDKYFLLPEGWSHGAGAAIVLDDTPTLRFEFGAGR